MKKTLFFLFFLISFNEISFSQDLTRVDKIMYSYNGINSIEELSERIDYDFKTKIEKVRAIYTWIALNIEYNYFSNKLLVAPDFVVYTNDYDLERIEQRKIKQIAKKTFNAKKGVCIGYAYLFQNICNQINIENELIYGYTKSSVNRIGVIPKNKNHVWNAVKIDDKWILIDVTYGSGYIYKDVWQKKLNLDFFNAQKEKLRLTHFPANTKWQKFLNQKPLDEFCYAPFYQDGFLKSKIEILKPKIGEIVINSRKRIHLKLKHLNALDDVKYLFSNDPKIYNAKIINNETYTDIYFKNPKTSTNLHIYVNNKLTLEYKIKVY